ncbi:hypothetical protein HaLaN_14838, partial [Haematococcus lacustris]
MSGHKLCAGRFPSRAAAVACIRDWLQKEKVIETAETDEPLQVAEASDPGLAQQRQGNPLDIRSNLLLCRDAVPTWCR